MIDVIVQRGAGNRPGQDIFEPLLSSVPAAVARGRSEIDVHSDLQTVSLSIVYRSGLEKGQLVEVHDDFTGEVWRGKIVGVQHTVVEDEISTELTILRPVVFNPE